MLRILAEGRVAEGLNFLRGLLVATIIWGVFILFTRTIVFYSGRVYLVHLMGQIGSGLLQLTAVILGVPVT